MCAYFAMWVIRTWQTKKFFKINIKWRTFIPLIVLTFIFAIGVQFNWLWLDMLFELIAVVLAITINHELIAAIIASCANKLKR